MAQQHDRLTGIGIDLDRHHSELICFREVIDKLAQSDNDTYGVFGGLSYWLQRIIDDVEETKGKLPFPTPSEGAKAA